MTGPIVLKPIIDSYMQYRARAVEVYINAYMHLTGLRTDEIELIDHADGSWECRPISGKVVPPSEELRLLDELVRFAFEHGGTLRNHKEFGERYQELRKLLEE